MKSIRKRIFEIVTGTGGQEIAEFAVVFPLLLMALLAIISFGRAYNVYSTIVRAAQDGALAASTFGCAAAATPPLCTSGNNAPAPASDVVAAVTNAMAASKVDASQIMAYQPAPSPTPCPGVTPPGCTLDASKITICKNVQLNPSGTPAQCGSIVSFQYPYQFSIPFVTINLQTIRLTAVAERQMEN